jgi:hypothetical protein
MAGSASGSDKREKAGDTNISAREALAVMFAQGNTAPYADADGEVCIHYNPTPAEASVMAERLQTEDLHDLTARIVAILPFRQDRFEKCFVLAEIRPNESFDCHSCAPAVAGAIFLKNGDAWHIQINEHVITYIGSWGRAPKESKLVKIGTDRFGILIERRFQVHGTSDAYTILISQINDRLKVLWESPTTYEDNEGDCGEGTDHACYRWSSRISFKPMQNSSFYDIFVTTSGTKPADDSDSAGKVISFQHTSVYMFSDSIYVAKKQDIYRK